MNVLSLFDGMSCGRLALDRLGIKVDKYYASEIDKYAIQVASANYPDTIQIGDVCDVKGEDYPNIDLILGGSPCQGFSFAGHQLAFDDPRSALFFEFVRVLKEVNPKYFLLENVKMKKEFLDIISDQVGVEPILINSSLLSAQNRQRYYWTNIPGVEQPEDRGLVLKDILETEADERPTKDTERNRRHHKTPEQKSLTMTATMYKGAGNNGMTLVPMVDKIPDKSETIKSQYYKSSKANFERKGTFHATGVPLDKPKRVGTANIKGHDIKKRVYSGEGKSPSIIADSGTVPKIETKPQRVGKIKKGGQGDRVYSDEGKSITLSAESGGTAGKGNMLIRVVKGGAFRGRAYDKDGKRMDRDGSSVAHKTKQMLELRQDDKSNALTTVQKDTLVVESEIREKSKTVRSGGRGSYDRHEWDSVDEMHWRKLTPLECERLQTVPDNYTNHVSNTQRYKMLGNGWTIEVIAHILKGIQE
tara:strand:- start:16504 stop:17925 length:1422 start_codon:yes stop_codon:yes gene_type:complete